jgi:Sec-independent protein translocase protein TatA
VSGICFYIGESVWLKERESVRIIVSRIMKVGRGQLRILVILGFLLFGNLPRVIRETASSLRTRSSRVSESVDESKKSSEVKEVGDEVKNPTKDSPNEKKAP